jgi:nucleoside-diphosphate-sugar epimerase
LMIEPFLTRRAYRWHHALPMARTRRIVITGAAGFIGRAATERLVGEGAEVVGLDLWPSGKETVTSAGGEWFQGSTTNRQELDEAFRGATGVIHTAALVSDFGTMEEFIEVNVRGTRNVLDAAEASGVASVVHVSSVASWGYDFTRSPKDESFTRRQGVPYVDTKAASDDMALRRGAAVVRPGDVYGPRSVPWTIRPIEAMQKGSFVLPGGGKGLMTPVYVDDLVDLVLRALAAPEAAGRAVTGFAGEPVTASDFFDYYARMLGKSATPTAPLPIATAGIVALAALARLRGRQPEISTTAITFISRKESYATELAETLLGWKPQVSLDQGMQLTAEWLRSSGLLNATPAT